MKIIFAPSLMLVSVSPRRLVKWSLAYFRAWSANQFTQNKIQVVFENLLSWIVLFGFLLKLAFDLERELQNNFCSFPMVSYSQPNKFGQSKFSRFWAVLFQPVHSKSNISHFRQFSRWGSGPWFFIKTSVAVRKSTHGVGFSTSWNSGNQ